MKLTLEQIKSIAAGCMDFVEDGEGVTLRRFTDEQRAVYAPGHEFAFEALAAAGVALDFYTDSEFLTLVVDGQRELGTNYLGFDLLIDGVLCQHASCARYGEPQAAGKIVPYGPETLRFFLPAGEKRVTVQMPWDVTVRIRSLELSDGASLRPCEYKRTMIAFGDSITHGAFATYPSMTYICQTARMLDAKLYNFGIGGECFRQKKIISGTYPKCDFVTIAYGTNDFAHRTKEGFSFRLQAFLSQAAEEFKNVPIFIILPLWRNLEATGETKENGTLQSVRDRIREEAGKYSNMTVLDGSKWVPHLSDFFRDTSCLHPNDLGMSQYAMHLYAEIAERINNER